MISVSPNESVYCIAGTKDYSDDEFKENRFEFIKTERIVVTKNKKEAFYHYLGG